MAASKYLRLAALLRNEHRSPQQLAELQARKLRRLLEHAVAQVPFYRRLFRQAGVTPDDIRSAADLVRIPVVDKNLLRSQPLDDLIDVRRHPAELIERQTSGSSGSPFRFYADAAFDQHCKAQYLRPYLKSGRRPFDCVLRFTAFPDRRPRWFERLGLMREMMVGCGLPLEEQLAQLASANADIVQGYPSVLSSLAARIDPDRRPFRAPRIIFTDSELLTPDARRRIEQAFGAPVRDVFGAYETDNIAYECETGAGYHLAADCVVVEFLRDGAPVPPGESGQIVCTVLHNFAMPFVRYNLGDIAAACPEPCPCGNPMPLMKVVEGREVDCFVLPGGGRQSPLQFLGALDSVGDLVLEYQVVQRARDQFHVRIVPVRDTMAAAAGDRVSEIIRRHCSGARVTLEQVACIDREPSGKRRTFICAITA